MFKSVFFIADIAGEFDAFQRLLARAPEDAQVVCLGDLVDRGPKSRDVVEFLMGRSDIVVVKGNHEDMMVDAIRGGGIYHRGVWQRNGGTATLANYGTFEDVPAAQVDWLGALPYSYVTPDRRCYATHAPWAGPRMVVKRDFERSLEKAPKHNAFGMLWNRGAPVRQPMFGVFGHNSHWGLKPINEPDDEAAHAICIDQSARALLTGYVWPTREVLTEPYEVAR